MASWQSKIIIFIFKQRHLMQGRLKPQTWDEHTSIPAFREMVEKGAQKAIDEITAFMHRHLSKKAEPVLASG